MEQNRELEIKNKANALIKEMACQNAFPAPVEKIVKHLGYKIFKFSPGEQTSDISGAVDHHKKAIYINNKNNIRRQFFTIAHEIGHIILHGKDENFVDYRRDINMGSTDEKELETNYFAANLLMPENAFCEKWEEYEEFDNNTKITLLSYYFGASDLATRVRANHLDLLH